MARRLPSSPPVLPGFSHVHVLGSGGFADVFLYEQNMPRRQVAVKVMLSEVVNDQVRQMFQAEANLMAQLSAHPSILTVYQASVSADGRPYLVMELCSSSLSQRYRTERLPLAEVLRIAVKIGSAIETAHRAGVLHRDIKPSNILTTAYGHPVLSDFGIAATLGESESLEAVGMSIPWSAPEVLQDETAGTIDSEVWAYAATVFSLLAGRSPFEIPGESNKPADLMGRIKRGKPQPMGRTDVPDTLARLLATAMSRKPEGRHGSVLEIVYQLQSIESDLGLPQTPVEAIVDEWGLAAASNLEDRTRIRGHVGSGPSVAERRRVRRASAKGQDYQAVGTVVREPASSNRSSGLRGVAEAPSPRLLISVVSVASVLIVALIVGIAFAFARPVGSDIPSVTNIQSTIAGETVRFRWDDPGVELTDSFKISVNGGSTSVQRSPEFTYDAVAGERICLEVSVTREGRDGPVSPEKCAAVPL